MRKLQSRLTVTLLFSALAVIAFFVTAFMSGPIDFMYRDASGLSSARNIAQIAALLALTALFIAGFIITIPVALQPARLVGKIGKVLPVYLLLFALMAVIAGFLGVGAAGNLTMLQGIGAVSFIAAWLALAAVLGTVAIGITAARAHLSASTLKSAMRTTAVASGLSTIAAIAMLVSVFIVASSKPATFGGPGGGGFPGGNRPGEGGQTTPGQNNANPPNGQNAQGQQPEATGEARGGFPGAQNPPASGQSNQGQRPEGTGEPQGGFPGAQNGGRPEGGFPPDRGRPGGPGGGTANVAPRYEVGGALMAIFAVVGLIGGMSGLMLLRQLPSTSAASTLVNYPREAGFALLTVVGMTIVVVGLLQLVPVSRTNPPVKTPINWDSEQTKKLVYATCMDCHSNETAWPWYATVAPASWLTVMHVNTGRQEMNLSQMDSMPSFRLRNLADNMAQQIRSGNMPPKDYLLLHPAARLTDAEKEQLIQGLQKSLNGS